MDNSIAELRDNSAGRLTIGANESTTLYLLKHIERYRELYPKIKVQIRRSLSSKLPNELLDGKLVERNMGWRFCRACAWNRKSSRSGCAKCA
jgi:DNA-binding transcriptional LysR family regulator